MKKLMTLLTAVLAASVIAILSAGYAAAGTSGPSFPGCPMLSEDHSTGPCVVQLQDDLNTVNPAYNLRPDGIFGSKTRIAVLDFQGRNQLGADGLVGAETADKLTAEATRIGSVPTPVPGQALTPFEICQQQRPGSVSDGHGGCVADGVVAQGKSLQTCLEDAVGKKLAEDILAAVKNGGNAAAEQFVKSAVGEGLDKALAAAEAVKCISIG